MSTPRTGRPLGRPTKFDEPMRTLSVTLPLSIAKRIEDYADEHHMARSDWLRRAVMAGAPQIGLELRPLDPATP